jgi:transcriptional regulator with PAS, ATPase and Fis domain
VRGAFTGAEATRLGRFEMAQGGTLLLDEITEIDLGLQAKLLRVLQERCFERVGSSESIRGDVRVLATTNRDLQQTIAAGMFREDLYYRLAVVPIEVPPLRERRADVAELVDHFLARATQRLGGPPRTLERSAYQLLEEYHWPGNVRELQNLILRASVLLSGSRIAADDLRRWLQVAEPESDDWQTRRSTEAATSLADVERRHIERTLAQFGGHREKTARALGIGVRTLSGKLRQYGYAAREKRFTATRQVA